jgi:hypothetical protein
MISLEPESMVGAGGGRFRDSVRAPAQKIASRAAVFLSQVEVAAWENTVRVTRARSDSLVEKSR